MGLSNREKGKIREGMFCDLFERPGRRFRERLCGGRYGRRCGRCRGVICGLRRETLAEGLEYGFAKGSVADPLRKCGLWLCKSIARKALRLYLYIDFIVILMVLFVSLVLCK